MEYYMKNYNKNKENFKTLIKNLESDKNIKIYSIDIECRPTNSLFTDTVKWEKLYFNKNNPLESYVQSGNINNFNLFSFCTMEYFIDNDKVLLLDKGIQQLLKDNISK